MSLALNDPIVPLVSDEIKTKTNEDFDDPDDIVFYEIVLTARSASNAYLITGNKKHYPIKSFVVTPREMIEIIEKDNK